MTFEQEMAAYGHEEIMLEDELKFKDLLEGGARFTLKSNFQKYDEMDDIFPELETGEEGLVLNNENIISPWEKPFCELIPTMTEIDGGIFKKIIRQPSDNIEMVGRCRVTITYAAYLENETMAFDSTHLRGDSCSFVTGSYEVLEGLEMAVKSMKRGEESQFVIPYQLLFGERGCPPRIKPKADALFVIQLTKFTPTGDENATEDANEGDHRKYKVMIDKILEVKASGTDYFRQGMWSKAVLSFHRAINRLEMCQLENEAEQKEQEEHLIKLYTNVMICYNKLDKPKKVCSAYSDLARLSNVSKNSKALYAYGKALMALGEYKRSQKELTRANQLEPNDQNIAKALRLLNKKCNDYKAYEANLCRKAFGNTETCGVDVSSENDQFFDSIKQYLLKFKEDSKQSQFSLPNGLTPNEIAKIKDLIKDMDLTFITSEVGGKKIHYLNKIRK